MRRWSGDRGSTVPLLVGFVIVAFLVVAGSVAAGDAFVQQQELQETCDGAAAAAASSADFIAARTGKPDTGSLPLANVEDAVTGYLRRDPARSAVFADAAVVNGTEVTVACTSRSQIAFGVVFGFGDGIEHHARSTARSPIVGP